MTTVFDISNNIVNFVSVDHLQRN